MQVFSDSAKVAPAAATPRGMFRRDKSFRFVPTTVGSEGTSRQPEPQSNPANLSIAASKQRQSGNLLTVDRAHISYAAKSLSLQSSASCEPTVTLQDSKIPKHSSETNTAAATRKFITGSFVGTSKDTNSSLQSSITAKHKDAQVKVASPRQSSNPVKSLKDVFEGSAAPMKEISAARTRNSITSLSAVPALDQTTSQRSALVGASRSSIAREDCTSPPTRESSESTKMDCASCAAARSSSKKFCSNCGNLLSVYLVIFS